MKLLPHSVQAHLTPEQHCLASHAKKHHGTSHLQGSCENLVHRVKKILSCSQSSILNWRPGGPLSKFGYSNIQRELTEDISSELFSQDIDADPTVPRKTSLWFHSLWFHSSFPDVESKPVRSEHCPYYSFFPKDTTYSVLTTFPQI